MSAMAVPASAVLEPGASSTCPILFSQLLPLSTPVHAQNPFKLRMSSLLIHQYHQVFKVVHKTNSLFQVRGKACEQQCQTSQGLLPHDEEHFLYGHAWPGMKLKPWVQGSVPKQGSGPSSSFGWTVLEPNILNFVLGYQKQVQHK